MASLPFFFFSHPDDGAVDTDSGTASAHETPEQSWKERRQQGMIPCGFRPPSLSFFSSLPPPSLTFFHESMEIKIDDTMRRAETPFFFSFFSFPPLLVMGECASICVLSTNRRNFSVRICPPPLLPSPSPFFFFFFLPPLFRHARFEPYEEEDVPETPDRRFPFSPFFSFFLSFTSLPSLHNLLTRELC